jgi:aryl-alcohol dehydrogenase-like predicted oxidoreductase
VAIPKDDWPKRNRNFQEPLLSSNLQLVETLRLMGQRHEAGPSEVAIACTVMNPAVTGAIVGVRNVQQVKGIAGAADLELTACDMFEIERRIVHEAA